MPPTASIYYKPANQQVVGMFARIMEWGRCPDYPMNVHGFTCAIRVVGK